LKARLKGLELGQAGPGLGPRVEDDRHGFFVVDLTKLQTKKNRYTKMKKEKLKKLLSPKSNG
jgi:hypothetical protein